MSGRTMQERDQARRERREKRAREQAQADLREVMGTPAGRRVVWRLLERCRLFSTSFTGNSETFFREGERSVGLWLLQELEALAPEAFATMWAEQIDARRVQRLEEAAVSLDAKEDTE